MATNYGYYPRSNYDGASPEDASPNGAETAPEITFVGYGLSDSVLAETIDLPNDGMTPAEMAELEADYWAEMMRAPSHSCRACTRNSEVRKATVQ